MGRFQPFLDVSLLLTGILLPYTDVSSCKAEENASKSGPALEITAVTVFDLHQVHQQPDTVARFRNSGFVELNEAVLLILHRGR